ncbi:LOW QUALITY PROTEIN: uncharacterized protein LOC108102332 [Drosophila eugracilis]|uniref:LOW QUALITY PROTEIN: uncharacterized protein LOC108102332 n=1 Tax=Drosophila eugracilis TaxID=29029 RepID=UPI001BDA1041|nr:LOW QUALITY PROTEIN: uncharacterized protein LOC108102332 [Drosophila eugracilis]
MHCSRILIKYIQLDVLVILATVRAGNANYLSARSRERNLNNNNGIKNEESSHILSSGGVRTVGEVFVPKTFSLNSQEPTCEQLRAMWIFSKRQSRAAEITNEIPTYRDPFTYNVWEPLLLNSRILGSLRMSARERARSPVFGRVVSREPNTPQRIPLEHHQRLAEVGLNAPGSSQSRYYGAETRPQNGGSSSSRRSSKHRYMGVPNGGTGTNTKENKDSVAIQGSFQRLKELIWTERAKELTEQRRDEELAARAAALKEITNGKNILANYYPQSGSFPDSILMDENRSPDGNSYQYSDDNRISILNEQGDKSNKNGYKTSVRATTRRIGNSPAYNKKEIQANKELKGLFPGSNRSARIKIPATDLFSSDSFEKDVSVIGIPRHTQFENHTSESEIDHF